MLVPTHANVLSFIMFNFLSLRSYNELGPKGNDIRLTNVPNIRIKYRHDTLQNELQLLDERSLENETTLLSTPSKAKPKIVAPPSETAANSDGLIQPSLVRLQTYTGK